MTLPGSGEAVRRGVLRLGRRRWSYSRVRATRGAIGTLWEAACFGVRAARRHGLRPCGILWRMRGRARRRAVMLDRGVNVCITPCIAFLGALKAKRLQEQGARFGGIYGSGEEGREESLPFNVCLWVGGRSAQVKTASG